MTLRVAVLISGHGTNLDALLAAARCGQLDADVCAVVCNRPGAGGIAVAQRAGVPVTVIDHRGFADRAAFDAAVDAVLAASNADLVVLAGFMRILSTGFVERHLGHMINIHPSLLPAFRGLHTHARALAAGVRRHGASVHFVTPNLDGGPPIAQVELDVCADDTPASLGARVLRLEHRLLPTVVQWCAAGRVQLAGNAVLIDGAVQPACGVRLRAGAGDTLVRVSAA